MKKEPPKPTQHLTGVMTNLHRIHREEPFKMTDDTDHEIRIASGTL
jgi:hypothetical protein